MVNGNDFYVSYIHIEVIGEWSRHTSSLYVGYTIIIVPVVLVVPNKKIITTPWYSCSYLLENSNWNSADINKYSYFKGQLQYL